MEVDHDRQLVFCETLPCHTSSPASPSPSPRSCTTALNLLGALQPSDEQVAARLSAPVVATQLDTRNISFERWAHNITIAKSLSAIKILDRKGIVTYYFGFTVKLRVWASTFGISFIIKCVILDSPLSARHVGHLVTCPDVSAGIKQAFLAGGVRKQRWWTGMNQRYCLYHCKSHSNCFADNIKENAKQMNFIISLKNEIFYISKVGCKVEPTLPAYLQYTRVKQYIL